MNVPTKQQKFSDCSSSGENSKALFLKLKQQNNKDVPVCSPFSLPKENRENVNVNISKIEENNIYKENNRKQRGNREQIQDIRFRSQRFRTAVRLVLESLGLEPNFGNFKKYDKAHNSTTPIDWLAFAHNLLHPVFGMAKCFILNGSGQRVTYQDKPQYNICEIRANSESEAVELIQSRGYEFGGFLSDAEFNKELRTRGGMVHIKSLPENTVTLVFG